ncbi:MAG: AraC family transcriptional regulator [Acidobacteria bacterium]|nr:AraC family transcriptional regulator [Acidobacteriota bacterium]
MSKTVRKTNDLKFAASDVYERLCRAREFIDLCYDLPLNLDQISSQACFSRYHFLRLFRQA